MEDFKLGDADLVDQAAHCFRHGSAFLRKLREALIDFFDKIVALLVELVDVALRFRDRGVVGHACLILFVPELHMGRRQAADQIS
jgi:hypothetical protein